MIFMKKSTTTLKTIKFKRIGGRICLPMIMVNQKTKRIPVLDETGKKVGYESKIVNGREKTVELWIAKSDIGPLTSYITTRNQISKFRCWLFDTHGQRQYLIASSPENILINIESQTTSGYGNKI
jgi:hypothetical protein